MKSTINKTEKTTLSRKVKKNSAETVLEDKKNCRNIFVEELKEIYLTEKALLLSIPIMIEHAATEELVKALKVHLKFTIDHIKRLEDFFESIGEIDIILKYEAMYGLASPQKTEELGINPSKK